MSGGDGGDDGIAGVRLGGLKAIQNYQSNAAQNAEVVEAEMQRQKDLEEWDQVNLNREHIDAANQALHQAADENLVYKDAVAGLMLTNWHQHIGAAAERVQKARAKRSCSGLRFACARPTSEGTIDYGNSAQGKVMQKESDFLLCMNCTKLDHGEILHRRLLVTLHKQIMGDDRNVATTGSTWERIGFQGNDPGTDLRAAGMLALLQLSALFSNNSSIAQTLWRAASSTQHEFPLALCGINFTGIAGEVYRSGRLHSHVKRCRSPLTAINDFYVGLFCRFYAIWCSQPMRTISEWDGVRRQLTDVATKHPNKIYSALEAAKSNGLKADGAAKERKAGPAVEFSNLG